jgi:hypothetical protein
MTDQRPIRAGIELRLEIIQGVYRKSVDSSVIADVVELSAQCSKGECIKVIYLARHGHGKPSLLYPLVHYLHFLLGPC